MCGVVGVSLDNVTKDNIDTIKKVFLETEIRGKHASGIAWYNGEKIQIKKSGCPISEFLKYFELSDTIYKDSIRLIGHIRYSTSDIHYHQPIGDGDSYIAHNGVISQSDSETWKEKYKYQCSTKNDSELLYNSIKNNNNYNKEFPGCSVSAVFIHNNEITYTRNSLRPQWKATLSNGFIIASTRNILLRAGIKDELISKVSPSDNKERIHRNLN